MINYKLSILVLGLLSSSLLFSQSGKQTIELGASLGGGLSTISYETGNYETSDLLGYTFDVDATYFITKQWGVALGLGIASYNATNTTPAFFSTVNGLVDVDGHSYDFTIDATDVAEEQHITSLSIPITAQYRYTLSPKLSLDFGAGLLISIPMASTYRVASSDITTQAFYTDLNWQLKGEGENEGVLDCYENRTNWHPEGDMDLKTSVSLLLEAGARYSINDKFNVNAKAFFSYGLNDISNAGSSTLLIEEYETYNSISTMGSAIRLMQAGIMIGIDLPVSVKF